MVLDLEEGARGRVVIGEHALLLQVIDPPPARTRPALPAALTGGLLRQADWVFTGFVAASFILHFAFVVGLLEADWPVETALIPCARRGAHLRRVRAAPEDAPEERMVADASDAPSDTPADTTDATSTPDSPRTPRTTGRTRGADGPADPDQAAREALRASILTIGGIGGNDGAVGDLLRQGASTANQDELIAMATGTTVAATEGVIREREGAGCPGCDRVGSIRRLAGDRAGSGRSRRAVPSRRCASSSAPSRPIRSIRSRPASTRASSSARCARACPRCSAATTTSSRTPIGRRGPPDHRHHGHARRHRGEPPRRRERHRQRRALAACTIRSLRETRVRVGPSEPIEFRYPIVFRRPG
ncbi:MAG: hypothetical protein M5U28_55835 [Sandaracinaceae bacterium]|nr:hypothetical protein [Sandaracinaceae bacterium]